EPGRREQHCRGTGVRAAPQAGHECHTHRPRCRVHGGPGVMRFGIENSLQGRLTRLLVTVIVATGLVAGVVSFVWALHDANAILDGTLRETASLLASGQVSLPATSTKLRGAEPDDDILVIRLPPQTTALPRALEASLPSSMSDGFHTAQWQH